MKNKEIAKKKLAQKIKKADNKKIIKK